MYIYFVYARCCWIFLAGSELPCAATRPRVSFGTKVFARGDFACGQDKNRGMTLPR